MSIQQAYGRWSGSYDTNRNRTRDLEALVLSEALAGAETDLLIVQQPMKLFPSESYELDLEQPVPEVIVILKEQTLLTTSLTSQHTNKAFIGTVSENGFRLISSEIGRGAFCILDGQFIGTTIKLNLKIHKAFQVLLMIMLFLPLVAFTLSVATIGFARSVGVLVIGIAVILLFQSIIIPLAFRFTSRTALNKLIRVLRVLRIKKVQRSL